MPSLHVAWALWCAAIVIEHTHRRSLRMLAVAYPLVTTVVVLGTGNHYLLDAVAGAALWLVSTFLVSTYRVTAPRATQRSDDVAPRASGTDRDPRTERDAAFGG